MHTPIKDRKKWDEDVLAQKASFYNKWFLCFKESAAWLLTTNKWEMPNKRGDKVPLSKALSFTNCPPGHDHGCPRQIFEVQGRQRKIVCAAFMSNILDTHSKNPKHTHVLFVCVYVCVCCVCDDCLYEWVQLGLINYKSCTKQVNMFCNWESDLICEINATLNQN